MRFILTLSYKGTQFCGWQIQNDEPSIQEIIEQELTRILRVPIRLIVSGRTDAGVHAFEQVCHFDCDDTALLKLKKLLKKTVAGHGQVAILHRLNSLLPVAISLHSIKSVPDTFHARYAARLKEYRYYVLNSAVRNVFLNDYVWQISRQLDIKAIKLAAKYFVGEHDFSSFCASDSSAKTRTRKIKSLKVMAVKLPPPFKNDGELYCFIFKGEGFLKQMVRNIMGTLIAVGLKDLSPEAIKKILKAKSRQKASATAPARGLFLTKVSY